MHAAETESERVYFRHRCDADLHTRDRLRT